MCLADIIKNGRQKLGISQEEAARRIGISRSAMAQMETSRGYPSSPVLSSLIRVLDLDPREALESLDPSRQVHATADEVTTTGEAA